VLADVNADVDASVRPAVEADERSPVDAIVLESILIVDAMDIDVLQQ
jgi:hypothetical protein